MKDINQAVFEYLSKDSEIKELISTRLYPLMLPQEAPLPAVVYSPITANYDSALTGDTGFVRQTMQFNCHDSTFKNSRRLSRMIKGKLQDFSGDMQGLNIQASYIKSDYILKTNTALKFKTDEYISVIEFEFFYNEK